MTAKKFVSMVARLKTEEEFGNDVQPFEDYISTLNDLIETAREIEED